MGQRHQVMVVLPAVKYGEKDNPNNKGERVVAIHHQWLYGENAIHFLNRFLTYCRKGWKSDTATGSEHVPYELWDNAQAVLGAIYSVDVEYGYYHSTHAISPNPSSFDNDDGVTVIDLRSIVPKYCFMAVNDGGFESGGGEPYTPYSAEAYAKLYEVKDAEDTMSTFASLAPTLLTKKELTSIVTLAKKSGVAYRKETDRRKALHHSECKAMGWD